MTDNIIDLVELAKAAANKSVKCDCCEEIMIASDLNEIGLCHHCDLVQTFACLIEEQTGICSDCAIDLACDLVDYASSK